MTQLENQSADLPAVLERLGLKAREGYSVGITGPPGSGKSTLVDKLTGRAREAGQTVGIIAVDPTSHLTGGALLGDRVRMMGHSHDAGVFVRSMAARRTLGGLAAATRDVGRLLAAAGFDLTIIETVGVGQSELDIVKTADSVVVVAVPGLGDSVQTLKAGLLEVADLFVVNKADRPGADRTVAELRAMQGLVPGAEGWLAPIVQTVATENQGIEDLWQALARHREFLESSGERARRRERRLEAEVFDLVQRKLQERLQERLQSDGELANLLEAAKRGALDPHAAAARIVAQLDTPAD
jgi:LAO/AO transport system kinase